MVTALIILHVLVAIALILIVLLQTGKGANMGATFGGGSSATVFGSRGPASFLSKITAMAAVIFMLTSLSLSVISSHRSGPTSIMQSEPTPVQTSDTGKTEAPVAPAPAAPQMPAEQAKPIEPEGGGTK